MFIVYIEQRVLKIKSYKKLGLFFIPYSRLPISQFYWSDCISFKHIYLGSLCSPLLQFPARPTHLKHEARSSSCL